MLFLSCSRVISEKPLFSGPDPEKRQKWRFFAYNLRKTRKRHIKLYIFEIYIKFCVEWYIIWDILVHFIFFDFTRWCPVTGGPRGGQTSIFLAKNFVCVIHMIFTGYVLNLWPEGVVVAEVEVCAESDGQWVDCPPRWRRRLTCGSLWGPPSLLNLVVEVVWVTVHALLSIHDA